MEDQTRTLRFERCKQDLLKIGIEIMSTVLKGPNLTLMLITIHLDL